MHNQCSRLCFRLIFSKTIDKKKNICFKTHVYVVNLDPTVMTLPFRATIDIYDRVQYNSARTPSSGPIVPHCVVDINASPECQCHHHRVKVNDIDMF